MQFGQSVAKYKNKLVSCAMFKALSLTGSSKLYLILTKASMLRVYQKFACGLGSLYGKPPDIFNAFYVN